jgi:aminobenzoyl-glutamate transport protein
MASWTQRALDLVERAGNRLPHPFWLFCGLFLVVTGLSAGLAGTDIEQPETQLLVETVDGQRLLGVPTTLPAELDLKAAASSTRLQHLQLELWRGDERVHQQPVSREQLAHVEVDAPAGPYRMRLVNRPPSETVRSLLSRDGLVWFVLHLVENFAHFEPLGLVLVMLMGVSIAEGTGMVAVSMRAIVSVVPDKAVTPVLFALAACGNIGSDAGIVVIPPLAAAIYKQLGRNPIGGLLVGYVGATAGFTANLLPAGTDVLAMALTNAATGGNPEVNVFCNIYFMASRVFFLAAVGTLVTHRITLPRLGPAPDAEAASVDTITPQRWRALAAAWVAVGIGTALWLLTILPEAGLLRSQDPDPAMIWRSPFFKGLVPILFTLFVAGGVVYGKVAGTLNKSDELISHMTEAMKRMGAYIVLILVISQFIRAFQWANLDQVVATRGASMLRVMGMEQYPLPFFIAFIGVVAVTNLFMGSASAKWAIFAPIFVPMFMGLGLHPAFTQLLYRMGDSITNCVSPLYPFFPVLLGWIAGVDPKKAGVGTVLSYLVPYALWLMIGWVLMLTAWYFAGLPVGPDSPIWL